MTYPIAQGEEVEEDLETHIVAEIEIRDRENL